MKSLSVCVAMATFLSLGAATNYVDCVSGIDGEGRGDSIGNAWKTLQYAADNSAEDDTVLVAPGTYAEGGSGGYRLSITKRIRFISLEGAEKTHIAGKTGEDGVPVTGCVKVSGSDSSTVIHGFTLRDATAYDGAAAHNSDSDSHVYLMSCVISNCVAANSYLFRCRLHRCLVTDNGASRGTYYAPSLSSCVFTRNKGTDVTLYPTWVVNCTFAGNPADQAIRDRTKGGARRNAYNCVFLHDVPSAGNTLLPSNCVFTVNEGSFLYNDSSGKTADAMCHYGVSPRQVMSPCDFDWRVVRGSETENAGDASYLKLFALPKDFEHERYLDFHGNTIPQTGAINAGAVQETASAVCGFTVGSTNVLVRGRAWEPKNGKIECCYESWPKQVRVETDPSGMPPVNFICNGTYTMPERDGSYLVTLTSNFSQNVSVRLAEKILYVDKSIGDDTYDGTAETPAPDTDGTVSGPTASIQAAVDAAGNTATVIYVKPGVYDSGERFWHGSNRVYVASGKLVRIIAAGSRDETVIFGTADYVTTGNSKGLGTNSVRCVGWGAEYGGLQGFTLTNGRTRDYSLKSANYGYGGAVYTPNLTPCFSECMISNNAGLCGGTIAGGWFSRCFIVDNDHHRENYDTVRNTILSSCVIDGNRFGMNPGDIGALAQAFNCTIRTANNRSYHRGPPNAVCNCIVVDSSSRLVAKWGVLTNSTGQLTLRGTLYDNVQEDVPVHAGGYVEGNAEFVGKDTRDFRITSFSDAIGIGVNGEEDFLEGTALTNYCNRVSRDIEGNPLTFTDGRPTAGAYQKALRAVRVSGKHISPSGGTYVLEPGDELTVSAKGGFGFRGFLVNGELLPASVDTYTVTAGDRSYAKDESVEIEALYSGFAMVIK